MVELNVGVVVIGRNEGDRLVRCLRSLKGLHPLIYVDSGSTDGSVDAARHAGAAIVELDSSRNFTAALARNTGLSRLDELAPSTSFVQVIDGDCELRKGWIEAASAALEENPDVAIVCGRRRELNPRASIWNQLIDMEWNTPVGFVAACGGDALLRLEAIRSVGGYNASMIAGEEPELCFRLRRIGWRVLRIDTEMTFHDAAMTHTRQWWRRNRRAGYAYAESAALHGFKRGEMFCVAETSRALFWGLALPMMIAISAYFSLWALLLCLVYPLQVMRLFSRNVPLERAFFLTVGKVPEAQGALAFFWNLLTGRHQKLIEYK